VANEAFADRGPRLTVVVSLSLLVGTLAVFGPVCANDFVNYDDPQYVTANTHVKAGLRTDGIRWAFTSAEILNWHPLTWLSLQLDAQLYGLHPWGYHLTNLLLHSANTVLLFLILRWLTGAVWPSALVAALFGIHPLHVESVAWVAERKDVLSTFFGLLALAAYLYYVQRPGLLRYLPVLLALALSLMAKPMLVTLPVLLLLLDYWPLGRLPFGKPVGDHHSPRTTHHSPLILVLGEKLPLVALAVVSSVLTVIAQGKGGAIETLEQFPLGQRVGNAVVSYVRYLGMTLWPEGLAPFYPRTPLAWWQVAAAAVLLAGLTALALASPRRRPYLVVGWLWYVGTLIPVIGLVQVGEQALADRYTYVPLIGLFIMAAWGLADLAAHRSRLQPLLVSAAAVVLLACAVLTWRQISFWRDARTLWDHALQVTAANHVAENNMAAACMLGKGTLEEAEQHLRRAVAIKPDYWGGYARLGIALDKQGKLDEAVACYSRSLALQPDQPTTRNNLAVVLGKQGKLEEGIAQLQEAVRLDPGYVEGYFNLAFALARARRLDEAVEAGRKCVQLQPRKAAYRRALATFLQQRGDDEAAEVQFREAERLEHTFP
jgi:tetratricopeptide (TPR) repeat protein